MNEHFQRARRQLDYASPQDHQTYDFIVLAQEPETDPKFVIVDSVVQQPQNIEQQLKTLTQDGRVVMAYRHRDEKSNLLEDLVRLKNGERDLVPHDDKSMRSSIPTISSAPDEAMREIDHFVLIGREYNLSNGQIVRFAQKAVDNFHSGIRMSYEDVIKNFVLSGD